MNIGYEQECFWIVTVLDKFGRVSSVEYPDQFAARLKYVEWENSAYYARNGDVVLCIDKIHPHNSKSFS